MPIREFIDSAGVRWSVWSTVPFITTGVPAAMQRGWLTFESGNDRRRLAPLPDGWEEASIDELRVYWSRAERVGRTPHSGVFPVTPRD